MQRNIRACVYFCLPFGAPRLNQLGANEKLFSRSNRECNRTPFDGRRAVARILLITLRDLFHLRTPTLGSPNLIRRMTYSRPSYGQDPHTPLDIVDLTRRQRELLFPPSSFVPWYRRTPASPHLITFAQVVGTYRRGLSGNSGCRHHLLPTRLRRLPVLVHDGARFLDGMRLWFHSSGNYSN